MIGEGRYRELLLTNRQYAFARIGQGEAVLVGVNNDEKEAELLIPLPIGAERLWDLETGEERKEEGGKIRVTLPPGGSILIGVNTPAPEKSAR